MSRSKLSFLNDFFEMFFFGKSFLPFKFLDALLFLNSLLFHPLSFAFLIFSRSFFYCPFLFKFLLLFRRCFTFLILPLPIGGCILLLNYSLLLGNRFFLFD